jgi:phospholipase/carboxylesterase
MAAPELGFRTRGARGEPQGALLLLHGRGADEYDLEPLADELDRGRQLVAVLPRAPLALPPGGAHWYVVPRVGFPDPPTFEASLEALGRLSAALPGEIGVPLDRTVLVGFSQGAVMSLALALGAGRPSPAGILALSGFIPTVPGFELDLTRRADTAVLLAHGSLDPVIPVTFGRAAHERLAAAGVDVEYLETAVPHTIDGSLLPRLRRFVGERLGVALA